MFLKKTFSLTVTCLAFGLIGLPSLAQNESATPVNSQQPTAESNQQTTQPASSGCQTEDPAFQPWIRSLYQDYHGNNVSPENPQETSSTESPATWLRREVDIGRKIFYKCSPLLNQSNSCKNQQTDLEKKFVKFILEVHARKIIAAKYANNKFLKRFAKGSETPSEWWTHQTDFLKETLSMKCE
jgi:hypothetical protein